LVCVPIVGLLIEACCPAVTTMLLVLVLVLLP